MDPPGRRPRPHPALTSDSSPVGWPFIWALPSARTLRDVLRLLRIGLLLTLAVPSAVVVMTAMPEAAQTGCLPPPNLLLTQTARVAGISSPVWADIQAVGQRDAALPTAAGGQVIQDLLAAINHDGYQWDCATSQLVSTPGAAHPSSAGNPGNSGNPRNGNPGKQAAPPASPASAASPNTAAGSAGTTTGGAESAVGSAPASSTAAAGTQTAAAANTSNSSNGVTSPIPTILIVVGLLVSAAAVVLAVRRASRH
jgi:hypothetical protein